MNLFITPLGLVRWAGAAVLGFVLSIGAFALRAQGDEGLSTSAVEFYDTIVLFGLTVGAVSAAVVGVGLLTAQWPAPEVVTEPDSEIRRH